MSKQNYTQMSIMERIEKFHKKYHEPYQMPFTAIWERKDGCHTQRFFTESCDCTPHKVHVRSGGFWYTQYLYDDELGLFEIGLCRIDSNTPKKDDPRRWVYESRCYIPNEEKVLYNEFGGQCSYFYRDSSNKYGVNVTNNTNVYFQAMHRSSMWHYNFEESFKKLIGNRKRISGGVIIYNYRPWVLQEWFNYTERTKSATSNTQKKINKLLDTINLKELSKIDYINLSTLSKGTHWGEDNYCFLENHDDVQVFRCFVKEEGEYSESKRIYVRGNKPEVIAVSLNSKGEWVPNGQITDKQFSCRISNIEDLFKIKRWAFLKEIIELWPNYRNALNLRKVISIMKTPEIELLYKMNLKFLAFDIGYFGVNGYGMRTSSANVEGVLGTVINPKKRNILEKFGLSKAQLEYMNRLSENRFILQPFADNGKVVYKYTINPKKSYQIFKMGKAVQTLQEFHNCKLSSLDTETFNRELYAIEFFFNWRTKENLMRLGQDGYVVFRRLISINEKMKVTPENKDNNIFSVFDDAISCYNRLNREYRTGLNLTSFKNRNDIVRFHDICVELLNRQTAEQREFDRKSKEEKHKILEKKMEKLDKERAKYNYEEGNFFIKLPQKLNEISTEGMELHHCVGSYINRHATGDTTILFLRKKSEPNVPFYTIEILGDTMVNQIHGKYNRWLGNNPEAIPCVYHWLQKHGLNCSDRILRSTAKGYSDRGATLVPMPVV